LNLAVFIAQDFKRHLTEQFGSEAGAVVDALAPLVQPDGQSRTGVTNLTATNAEMLVYVMADHLLPIIDVRAVEADELRLLLEGLPGAAVVGRHMLAFLHQVHPELGLEAQAP